MENETIRDALVNVRDYINELEQDKAELETKLDAAEGRADHAEDNYRNEREELKRLEEHLFDRIPDWLKDVQRDTHTLEEVIQRIGTFAWNR